MRDAPQAGLDPAQHDRAAALEMLADQVAVDDDRPVRPPVVDAAGRVVVGFALAAGGGVVGHHRIDAAAADAPEQLRLAQPRDVASPSRCPAAR